MNITTRVIIQIIETDEDYPETAEAQQRKVTHVEQTQGDPAHIDAVAYISGVAVGRAMTDLKNERKLHPRRSPEAKH